MAYCCSQCSFTAQFESALTMHHQLHHENDGFPNLKIPEESSTLPRDFLSSHTSKNNMGAKLLNRTSSATKLLGRIRARLCKSRTNLFSHPEEQRDSILNNTDITAISECTSKAMKGEYLSRSSAITTCLKDSHDVYSCHLCDFDADRITALDRHLLNDHKIGLDNLLKLVLAKTKDGLAEESPNQDFFGLRTPYYKSVPVDEIIEQGEFLVETVSPQIKILKHVATNTDLSWLDIPDLKDNYKEIRRELNKLIKSPVENQDLLEKMNTLNECMCKFVDSSNTLKKVLSKEYDGKRRKDQNSNEPLFDLALGDHDTPRDWERAHSEQFNRNKSKSRAEKSKLSAESFYF